MTAAPADVLDEDVRDRLRTAYRTPARSYHDWAHARRVAAIAAELGADRACLLAAWFHDAVHEPGAPDNEERSAQLLERLLADDPDTPRAAALVRMTATHLPPDGDRQAAILSDADLAVLGGPAADYEAYRRAVRAEYAAVGDEAWRVGRGDVLRDLLERDRIYRTDEGHDRWEAAARRNLRAELDDLT